MDRDVRTGRTCIPAAGDRGRRLPPQQSSPAWRAAPLADSPAPALLPAPVALQVLRSAALQVLRSAASQARALLPAALPLREQRPSAWLAPAARPPSARHVLATLPAVLSPPAKAGSRP